MRRSLNRLFEKLMERRGKLRLEAPNGPDGVEMLQSILDVNEDALAVHDAAQNDMDPSVILKPIIRPGPSEAGWFGGEPMLPSDVAWPQIDGVPLDFLAQIDLAKIPPNIWSGLGPRDGHLVFFGHPDKCKAKVLHVCGDLSPRSADVPMPKDRPSIDERGHDSNFLRYNRFGVSATEHKGQLPSPPIPKPLGQDREMLDFAKPEHRPFNEASLASLIEHISADIDMRLTQCDYQLKRTQNEEITAVLLSTQEEATKTRQAFDAAVKAVQTQTFDPDRVSRFIEDISTLSLSHFDLIRDSGSQIVGVEPVAMTLVDPAKSTCAGRYLGALDSHLFQSFVENKESLPAPHLDRIERSCEAMATREVGGMSHAPHGFIYTPHGSGSPNEVLLELPSSNLIGWMWGDVYSLVFLINRKALKRGKFDKVQVDITN